MENDRHQWFMDRIGKTIYRNGVTCDCKICTHITDHGLLVQDEMHADYLDMIEATPDMEVRYFDTMEEVLKFKEKL